MRLENDPDTNLYEETNRYTEDRLSKPRRKKKRPLRSALIVLAYLTALIAIMSVVALLNTWITDKLERNVNDMAAATSGQTLTEDDKITLTKEELDALLEQAASDAVTEAQGSLELDQRVRDQIRNDAQAEILDGIRTGLESDDLTTVEVLRSFYPENIVVASGGKYHFVPINYDLKMNPYDEANLQILESGEYQYLDGETVISHKGIDVSKFQGKIDWNAVAQDGVEFAVMRVANRGYGTGKLVMDTTFDDNFKGALKAGIHPAAYIYSQAISEEEIREEAQTVLDKVAPYDIKCPIVYDVEKTADVTGRMNQLSLEERTNLTLLFCQIIEEAGYKPIIYHNVEMGALMIDVETLEQYDKWLAYYNGDMYYPYDYKIWQYTDKGKVNGIKGNVDMNISFEAFWETD